jgi:hypothetical protein
MMWLVWLWSGLAAPAPMASIPPLRPCGVLGPSEVDLQRWLHDHEDDNDDDRWRMRLSALAPQVVLGGQADRDNDLRSKKQPGVAEAVDNDQGTSQRIDAQVRWNLADVVFHPRELEAQRNLARTAEQRRQRQLQAVDLFYARAEQRQLCLSATDDEDAAAARRQVGRLTSSLQVVTGGWFLSERTSMTDWD